MDVAISTLLSPIILFFALGMGAALLIAGPWMLAMLVEFTQGLYERIPYLIG